MSTACLDNPRRICIDDVEYTREGGIVRVSHFSIFDKNTGETLNFSEEFPEEPFRELEARLKRREDFEVQGNSGWYSITHENGKRTICLKEAQGSAIYIPGSSISDQHAAYLMAD